jgi:hypothetical protein
MNRSLVALSTFAESPPRLGLGAFTGLQARLQASESAQA